MTAYRRLVPILCATICALLLCSCAQPKQPPLPVGNLKIGVAYFSQPETPADMLAGYTVENAPRIDEKILNEMDAMWASVLATNSKNNFRTRESAMRCKEKVANQSGGSNNQAALRTWASIGRCMGVDLLVVPHLFEFRERDGGSFGVEKPAKIIMDIYVLDVRNEALVSRSRFDETQSSLSANLLEADKFFKRGGKWITAQELAREGMVKAVKDLGL